ncbi:hypothetical protein, partial [Gluconacetobacter entanii]
CQYEAIHTGFESHLVTLKKYNSQQALKRRRSPDWKSITKNFQDLPAAGEGTSAVPATFLR